MGLRELSFDIFAVDRASKVLDHVGNKVEHMGSRFGKAGEFAALGLATISTVGMAAVIGATMEGIKSAADYQKITSQTGAVLKSTGGAAKVTAKQVQELAQSIEHNSTFSDEAVQSGENLLLTFTNIRNGAGKNNDIFNQSTKALFDMSQALGEDPKNAAIQLGKALNDPIKGVTALRRVGVSFDAQQTKTIKTMVHAGNTMGAQKLILHELGREFGGSAAAAGDTFSGSLTKMKNAGADLLRDAFTPLLPILTTLFTTIATKVLPWVEKFAGVLAKNLGPIIKEVAGWVEGEMHPAFVRLQPVIHAASLVVGEIVGWFRDQLMPALERMYTGVMPTLRSAFESVSATMAKHKDIVQYVIAVFKVIGKVITDVLIPTLMVIVRTLASWVGPAFSLLADLISNIVIPAIKFIALTFEETVGAILQGAVAMLGWVPGLGPQLRRASAGFDKFKHDVNGALNGTQSHKTITISTPGSDAAYSALMNIKAAASALPKGMSMGVANKLGMIPGHAAGTSYFGGGLSWVGERGPELVRMTPGSQVYDNRESMAMSSKQQHGGPMVGVLNVYAPEQVARRVVDDLNAAQYRLGV